MSVLELSYVSWSPIIWVIAVVVIIVLAYLFRSLGQKKYKKDTAQTQIFLSGEEMPETELLHIKAHNIYWGFFQTLKGYYDKIVRPHTGIINDYIAWFVVVLVISAVILFLAGSS